MEPVASNWKLTFDPLGDAIVLLDYGDLIDGELTFPARRGLEVVERYGQDPLLRVTDNKVVTLAWDVMADKATDALARQEIMDSLLATMKLGRKPIRVEVSGITDRYWEFAEAYITEHDPRRFLKAPTARHAKKYSATCTGFDLHIQIEAGQTHSAIAYAPNQITNTHSAA